ncbi:MAG: hypothetical protein JNL73_03740 [Anaerolineales bacterium]|nr:hypothetical protein [Anaerolineales bacterium]
MVPSDLTWTLAVVGGIHYLFGVMFVVGALRILYRGRVEFVLRWPGSLPAQSKEDLKKWSDLAVTDRLGILAIAALYFSAGAYLLFQLGISIPVYLEVPHSPADWILIATTGALLTMLVVWLQDIRLPRANVRNSRKQPPDFE